MDTDTVIDEPEPESELDVILGTYYPSWVFEELEEEKDND